MPLRAQKTPPQQPSAQEDGSFRREDIELLRDRYRPSIHPGDPLHIVGSEQGGNSLRTATPLLARGEHTPQQVNIEASHQRALEMYGDGTLFHAALPSASRTPPTAGTPQQHPSMPEPTSQERGPATTPWSMIKGVLVSALLIVWFFMRVRPALVAPQEEPRQKPDPFVWRPASRASVSRGSPYAQPSSPLPQRSSGITNGARMAKQSKRR